MSNKDDWGKGNSNIAFSSMAKFEVSIPGDELTFEEQLKALKDIPFTRKEVDKDRVYESVVKDTTDKQASMFFDKTKSNFGISPVHDNKPIKDFVPEETPATSSITVSPQVEKEDGIGALKDAITTQATQEDKTISTKVIIQSQDVTLSDVARRMMELENKVDKRIQGVEDRLITLCELVKNLTLAIQLRTVHHT